LKVVDQAAGRAEIWERQVVVLHFQGDRIEPAGRDHVVWECGAVGRIDDRDGLGEAEQLRKVAGALLGSGDIGVRKLEPGTRSPFHRP